MGCAGGIWWMPFMMVAFAQGNCTQNDCDANPLLQLSHQVSSGANATMSPKQVGEECSLDTDCASGICALTWFGFMARELMLPTLQPGLANKACQLKLSPFSITLQPRKKITGNAKATRKYLPKLRQAVQAWTSVIRGLALKVPGASTSLVLEYAFVSSTEFGKKYCQCQDNCCKSLTGSSGPKVFYQADPNLGLRGMVTKAEIVFTTSKLSKYAGTSLLQSLFLREVGVALGICSLWEYLGMVYQESSNSINTLTNIYANAGEMTGGWLWEESKYVVLLYERDTRNMPLPTKIDHWCPECGWFFDAMQILLEEQSTIGPQSAGFLHDLGYAIDYEKVNVPFAGDGPCAGCNRRPKLLKPNMQVKNNNGKTITTVKGFGFQKNLLLAEFMEGSPMDRSTANEEEEEEEEEDEDTSPALLTEDAEASTEEVVQAEEDEEPAGGACNTDTDCLSGVCVTSMVGFLKSNGYDLPSQGITGFESKICKPKLHDFDIVLTPNSNSFPEYTPLVEGARDIWMSLIRGISKAIVNDVNPVLLEIVFDWYSDECTNLGQAGPTNVVFVDAVDGGAIEIPVGGILNLNVRFLEDGIMTEEEFKAAIVHEMGHILLIGYWDLFTTSAECDLPDYFTDAYLDGGGKAAMAHYILSEQWKNSGKTPLRLYRTPSLSQPWKDCTGWDEFTVDNELMSPFLNAGTNPLSIITAGALEDLGYTIDYKECDIWPDAETISSVYTFRPQNNARLNGANLTKKKGHLVDYTLSRPDLRVHGDHYGKVITTVPGDLQPEQLRSVKKELQKLKKPPGAASRLKH